MEKAKNPGEAILKESERKTGLPSSKKQKEINESES